MNGFSILTCNMSTTCYLWDLGAIAICCALCQLPTICLGFNQSFLRGNQKIWTRSSRVYRHEEHRLQVEKGENYTRHLILGNCFSCLSENSLELIRSLKIRLARSSANCPWINTENKGSLSNSNPYLCSNVQIKLKKTQQLTPKWSFSPLARPVSPAQQVLLCSPWVPLRDSGQCQRWPWRWFTTVWGL